MNATETALPTATENHAPGRRYVRSESLRAAMIEARYLNEIGGRRRGDRLTDRRRAA
jgi:hypothetical protein